MAEALQGPAVQAQAPDLRTFHPAVATRPLWHRQRDRQESIKQADTRAHLLDNSRNMKIHWKIRHVYVK